ncbi:hypothetical protein CYMTET_34933 [Cymbomonas tetramitiformis]|uniref:Pyruvate kinase n=1 Tax=Cymbomonas tetramitiformis TaxID=36881 RepID=A0AAE0FA67_9CHLO|nr:hypothetical protein CYMTET_34933 [Cymbomonas tetramitiformis]
MCDTPRPTRAEATDVANAVIDGADAILLGAETLRGQYPTETVKTVANICWESEHSVDLYTHFCQHMKGPLDMEHEESSQVEALASSAVRATVKAQAALIIVFSQTGATASLIAKFRPPVPVLAVFVPTLMTTNNVKWEQTLNSLPLVRLSTIQHVHALHDGGLP